MHAVHLHVSEARGHDLSKNARENGDHGIAEIGIGEDHAQGFRLEISLKTGKDPCVVSFRRVARTRRCSLMSHDSKALNRIDVAIPASNRPTKRI